MSVDPEVVILLETVQTSEFGSKIVTEDFYREPLCRCQCTAFLFGFLLAIIGRNFSYTTPNNKNNDQQQQK